MDYRPNKFIYAVVLLVLSSPLILLYTSFRVDPQQMAVVYRWGEAQRESRPGLRFKWPAPIETVTLVDMTSLRMTRLSMPNGRNSANPLKPFAVWRPKSATLFAARDGEPADMLQAAFLKVVQQEGVANVQGRSWPHVFTERLQSELDALKARITVDYIVNQNVKAQQ